MHRFGVSTICHPYVREDGRNFFNDYKTSSIWAYEHQHNNSKHSLSNVSFNGFELRSQETCTHLSENQTKNPLSQSHPNSNGLFVSSFWFYVCVHCLCVHWQCAQFFARKKKEKQTNQQTFHRFKRIRILLEHLKIKIVRFTRHGTNLLMNCHSYQFFTPRYWYNCDRVILKK